MAYVHKKLFMIAMILLVVGGLNLGFMALTGKDIMSMMLGKKTIMTNIIFLVIGLAALAIGFYRDSYLPFLGQTVMPCSLLTPSIPEGADYEVRVHVKPGQKVMYWAAEPETKDLDHVADWRKAYLGFRNAGVVVANEDGYATLKVRKPQPYQVPIMKQLSPHVHYRVCLNDGMVSRIETITLDGKEYFENLVEHEGFATEEEKEGFRAAMPPGEEEGFVSSIFKSHHEKVPASSFDTVQPETAQDEIDAVIHETARRSLMAELSAIDESPNKYVNKLANAEFQ